MADSPRGVFFPLRSNAKALVAGAPVESVRRRLKLCSLAFDHVYLERGARIIAAGPTGAFEIPIPRKDGGYRWQSPSARRNGGGPWTIGTKKDGAAQPYGIVSRFDSSIEWRPTFEPFIDELPAGASGWLAFATPLADPRLKHATRLGVQADRRSPALREKFPDAMVRGRVIEGVNQDLALSGLTGLALSMDALHRGVVACRYQAGTAKPACGPLALKVLFPQVERLPWDAIAELRDHRDLDYFRKTLAEIEEQALTMEGGGFDGAVVRAYNDAISSADLRMRGSSLRKFGLKGFGVLAGELLGWAVGVPLVGGVLGTIATDAVEKSLQVARTPRWRTFDRALRERTESGALVAARGEAQISRSRQ